MDGWMITCFVVLLYAIFETIIFVKRGKEIKRLRQSILEPLTEGKIIIDHGDPDGPYVFLQLDAGISDLSKRRFLYLEVDNQGLTRD